MMFLSNICYHTYTVVLTYVRGENEVWKEYMQMTRPRWTARETKMVWRDLHWSVVHDECTRVTAHVYECELDNLQSPPCVVSTRFRMRFSSTVLSSHYPELPVFDRADGVRVRKWYLAR